MCESQFKYTVNTQEFISKWLISDVMEVPFHAEPKPTVFPEYRPGVPREGDFPEGRLSGGNCDGSAVLSV